MKLKKKQFIFTALMLFSMFFGAGNLIFPPFSGNLAGTRFFLALIGILLTAVCFPVMGVAAVARTGGLDKLGDRVHPVFSQLFSLLIFLSIGPMIAIPRTATVPFALAIQPYIGAFNPTLALFLFTVAFFCTALWLSLNPSKQVERMGKVLTPILITLILVMFFAVVLGPKSTAPATGRYADHAILSGFVDGYQTLDVAASLVFGIVIIELMQSYGITDMEEASRATGRTGILAGIFLGSIYFMLSFIGSVSSGISQSYPNGAEVLRVMTDQQFGWFGAVLLALIFLLACMTTCVGLITCCSQYFHRMIPKISYRMFAVIISLFSLFLANRGLDKILAFSLPVLTILYPLCLVLIVLAFLDPAIHSSKIVYRLVTVVTFVLSICDALGGESVRNALSFLPLSSSGLGWLVPSIVALIVGWALAKAVESKKEPIAPSNEH